MGCVASKLEDEDEVVSICRERKNQLKLAVERRYALAEAHCRYHQSLFAVSAAIKVFVARHSSPSSPFLITFPPSSSSPAETTENPSDEAQAQNLITNPVFLQQMAPSEATIECAGFCDSSRTFSSSSSSSEEEEEEERHQEAVRQQEEEAHHEPSGYFYMQMQSSMASPQRDFGWDFFNPFDGVNRAEIISGGGYRRNSDEEELRVVREEEGIPELEEEEEEEEDERRNNNAAEVEERRESEGVMINNNNSDNVVSSKAEEGEEDQKGLQVIDTPSQGRELLEALKDVEDYFIKAHDSGLPVSRMLEANTLRMQSGLDHIKENSTKLNQSIAWHRSISSRPSTCKSLVASSSKSSSSSTWTEFNNELFDDYGGMTSGSHSLTLGRIYAWEKKLFEEVKAGDTTRKLYEKKCSRLRNQDAKGDDELSVDKTRAAVKDLYARILVAIRSAESISMRIEKLRDEELQPQILELLKGLLRTWRTMLEAHETQNKIMFEVKSFASHELGRFCTNPHRLATIQIVAELHNWRARLVDYMAAQRAYVAALHAWLAKFVVPEVELFSSRLKGSPLTFPSRGPPLLSVCRDWLVSTEKLPEKPAAAAMKGFAREIAALWDHQGEERRQMRKVNAMAKELERRAGESEDEARRREQLESLRARLEAEKERHRRLVGETHRLTLTGFRTGFCNVFESLIDFSKASQNIYNGLVERAGNDVAFIEDASGVEEANGSSR